MKNFKVVSLILALALVLTIFVGCGAAKDASQGTTAAVQATATAAPEPEAKKEPVKLTFSWWGDESRAEATLKAVDLWNKANPDIQVEGIPLSNEGYMDKLTTQLAGGNAPDLFNLESGAIPGFASNNQLLDITQYKDSYLKDVDAGLWAYYTTPDGKTWGIPFGQNGDCMAYNKTKLEQFGIRLPTNDETWDSIMDLMKQATRDTDGDGKVDFWGYHFRWFYSEGNLEYHLGQLGFENGIFTKDLKKTVLDDPKVIEEFKIFEKGRDYGPKPGTLQLKEGQQPISAGYVAFQSCAYSNFAGLAKSSTDELGVIALPTFPGGKDTRKSIGGIPFSINAKLKDPEPALKFASFFTSDPEAGKALGGVRGILPSKAQRDAYMANLGSDANGKISQQVFDVCNYVNSLGNEAPILVLPNAFNEWVNMFDEETQVYEYQKETMEQFFNNVAKKSEALISK